MAKAGVKFDQALSGSVSAAVATAGMRPPSSASRRWPLAWPSGTAFSAAITWFSAQAQR